MKYQIWIKVENQSQTIEADNAEDAKAKALELACAFIDDCDRICGTCDRMVDHEGYAYNSDCTYGDSSCDECGGCHCNQAC